MPPLKEKPTVQEQQDWVPYLKSIVRDTRGCFTSRESCEEFLNSWIQQSVEETGPADHESSEFLPLRKAHIEVFDHLFHPHYGVGYYHAVADLDLRLPSASPPEELCLPARIRVGGFYN